MTNNRYIFIIIKKTDDEDQTFETIFSQTKIYYIHDIHIFIWNLYVNILCLFVSPKDNLIDFYL